MCAHVHVCVHVLAEHQQQNRGVFVNVTQPLPPVMIQHRRRINRCRETQISQSTLHIALERTHTRAHARARRLESKCCCAETVCHWSSSVESAICSCVQSTGGGGGFLLKRCEDASKQKNTKTKTSFLSQTLKLSWSVSAVGSNRRFITTLHPRAPPPPPSEAHPPPVHVRAAEHAPSVLHHAKATAV